MYLITADLTEVKIKPATELEEILQNVKTILSTIKGSVPLDRAFGVDRKILDLPVSVVQAKITAAIVKAINEFEPRVRVTKVDYLNTLTEAMDGIIKPRVDIEIIESKLRGYVLTED